MSDQDKDAKITKLEERILQYQNIFETKKDVDRIKSTWRWWISKRMGSVFLGWRLKDSIKNLFKELQSGKVSNDTLGDVTTHVLWRITRIGIFGILIALIPILILIIQTSILSNQNLKLDIQNQLITNQNKRIKQQTYLQEADRRSSLIFLFNNILDKVDEELKNQEFNTDTLTPALNGRIISLSRALKPYQYLEGDEIISNPISPERGQLLVSLIESQLHQSTYENIFRKADFSNSELSNSNLNGAYLENANLKTSNLTGAKLEKANLNHINLEKAILNDVNFRDAKLIQSNLEYSLLRNSDMRNADMSGANLAHAFLKYARLDEVNLDSANLRDANLHGASLYKAKLTGVYCLETDLSNARLSNSDMRNSKLNYANLSEAYLIKTNLKNSDMTNCNLKGASLNDANLSGVDLSGADLRDINLIGTYVDNINWIKNLSNLNVNGAEYINSFYQVDDNAQIEFLDTVYMIKRKLID